MKKLIVAVLAVAMLISICALCVPVGVSAADAEPASATVGATITNTWTGTHKTEAELEAETGKSFTAVTSYDEFAAIANGTDANNLAYYCLVLPAGTETLSLAGKTHIKARSYIYFDFNGYTVDVSGDNNGVFGALSGCTVKNLKMTGTLRYVSDRSYYSTKKNTLGQSPLTTHGYNTLASNGVVHLDNIVSEVDWTIHQQHGTKKYTGAIISMVASGSTISNCVFNGTIVAKNDTTAMAADSTVLAAQVSNLGGIVGNAAGCTFTNCAANGSITIEKDVRFTASTNNGAYLGGIAGYANGSSFTHCQNNAAITVNGHAWTSDSNSAAATGYVGGITGYGEGTLTYTNCTNNATVNAAVGVFHTGGVLGSAYKSTLKMISCENTAKGSVISFVSGGTMRGIGGVLGYSNESNTTMDGCVNRGSVTQITSGTAPQNVFIGGIVGRFYTNKQSGTVQNCINEGVITGTENATNANSGAGGIVGTLQSGGAGSSLTISGSVNNAAGAIHGRASGGIMGTFYVNDGTCTLTITDCNNFAAVDAKYTAGGILASRSGSGTGTLNVSNCNNEGAVSADENAGGIVGYVGNNATLSTCVNKGSVTATYSGTFTKDVTGATANYSASATVRAGGIVGLANAGLTIGISDCSNYGSVNASGTATGTLTTKATADVAEGETPYTAKFTLSVDAGGIIPVADGALTISNCKTYGSSATIQASLTNSVKKVGNYATVSSNPESAGGIIGRVTVAPTLTGSIINENTVDAYYAGGIIGYAAVDLTVSGLTNLGHITGGISAGGIVGHAAQSITISGCTNGKVETDKGAVTQTVGNDAGGLGGIVGRVDVNLIMEGCTNYGHVYTSNTYGAAAKYVGGLVGRVKKIAYIGYTVESATTDARVMGDRCYNYGKITVNHVFNNSNTNYVGGILGEAVTGLYLANCENRGDIEVKASIVNNSSRSGVGGIVGVPFDAENITGYVVSCDNYGDIYYNSTMANTWGAAGIVGRMFNKTGATLNITNCKNFGNVYSATTVKMLYAGGVVGYHQGCALVISNCENCGDIDGDYAGGIDGYSNIAVTISDSTNNGHITGTQYAGGMIAYGNNTVGLTNCTGNGNVSAMLSAGGLGGYVAQKVTLNQCTVTDRVTITVTGDNGAATGYAGGLLGRGAVTPSVTDCVTAGKIVVHDWFNSNKDAYVGGLVAHTNGGTYTGCESNMEIIITNSGKLGGVGGLVGRSNATVTFTNCDNYGNISIDAASKFLLTSDLWSQGVGGLYGNGAASTFTNCINTGDITVYTGTAVGGIAGYPANGKLTATDCKNQGTITVSCKLKASSAVGGIVGWGTSGIDIKRCVNDAPINVTGTYHTGGIAGQVLGVKSIIDCENTAKGVITFKDDPDCSAMTGIGGILGYANESTATITYCVNHGNIVMPADSTGHKAYLGGILGRAANPCEFVISYCTNTGNITASVIDTSNISYAGGIVALHQSYNATANSEGSYLIEYCVNVGNLSAYRAGGILAHSNIGGNLATSLKYAGITITNSVNAGSVTAVSYAGGIAGINNASNSTGTNGADTSIKMTYVITDCANLGTVSGKYVAGAVPYAGNCALNISGFISAGKLIQSSGVAHIIAPVETGDYNKYTDTVTGCVYLQGINVGNGATDAYGATQKTADEITALLRGAGSAFVVYDKVNLEILYGIALDKTDKTGLEAAMEAVRQIVERGILVDGERNYFTITQYNADVAYQTLYALLYPANFESSFTIVLPVSINLTEGMIVTVSELSNITPKAKLYIKAAQAGVANGNNFKLYMIGDANESMEFCFIDENGDEVLCGGTLATFDWSSETGAHSFATSIKVDSDVPGKYKGTLTFTVDYDAGE